MKKIIFIELLHHHECLENPYLKFKSEGFITQAIIWEFVAQKLEDTSLPQEELIILKQPIRKQFKWLNTIEKIKYIFFEFFEIYKNTKEVHKIITVEKPDSIYINTIESPFLVPLMIYLCRLKNTKIYLTVHNISRLKVHFLKYFLFDFLIKKLITKSYRVILLWEYLKFSNNKIQQKAIYFNNRRLQEVNKLKSKKISFVVSGNLDYKTKDIESILQGFWKLLKYNTNYKDEIQLILLWQLNNKVETWIKEYKLSSIIKTFDHYVWEKDMDRYFSQAHYAIISTYKNSIYGKYKISWAYGDARAYWVSILLSEHYAPDYIGENIIRFRNNSLDMVLTKIMNEAKS